TPAGQLLVEIVEHEVAQKGRERAALRRALIHRTNQAVLQHSGVEERTDELEHPLVGDPCRDACHPGAVIDSVEKFFEARSAHNAVALGDIALRLGYCLMSRASRTEAVAVLGERRIPTLLQDLQQRLLDQSVDDTRHAELPDPAVRLGYLDPFDRQRLVGPR